MQKILDILYQGRQLNKKQSQKLLENIIEKKLSEIQITSALISMKIRGETFLEIAGGVIALLKYARYFPRPNCLFADITGTGGDGKNTINISTASAIVASTCNVKIIKHGNRSISSLIGSIDLLEKNNIFNINQNDQTYQARQDFDKLGICFLHASQYHNVFNYVMSIRKELKTPTLFNIIGPLANPSQPPLALIGVYKKSLLSPVIQTLKLLKYQRAAVVHCDGLDEIGLHAPTYVTELHNEIINSYTLTASDFGLHPQPLQAISCHSKEQAHKYMIKLLKGIGKKEHEYIVAANVALLLKLFGYNNLSENTLLALDKIHHGEPYTQLLSLSKTTKM